MTEIVLYCNLFTLNSFHYGFKNFNFNRNWYSNWFITIKKFFVSKCINCYYRRLKLLGLFTESLTYIFPGGRALKLIKQGVNITNSSNPFILTKNITLTVIDCCTPAPVRLVAHCIGAGATIVASVTSPNPVTIGSVIHLVTELYEHC